MVWFQIGNFEVEVIYYLSYMLEEFKELWLLMVFGYNMVVFEVDDVVVVVEVVMQVGGIVVFEFELIDGGMIQFGCDFDGNLFGFFVFFEGLLFFVGCFKKVD